MSSIECKCDVIEEDNFDGKTEVFSVGTSDSKLLWSLDSTILGVADSSVVGENLVVIMLHHLVNLSDLFMASLKVISLALLKSVLNEFNLAYLIEILKEQRNGLFLDWKITLRKVINYEQEYIQLNPFLMA